MAKLELCPLCGSIILDGSCCGCNGTEKKQEAKVKKAKTKKKTK